MARINLTSGKGWFRIWLVLSIAFWLYLTALVISNWTPGQFSTMPVHQNIEALLIYAMPFFVYAGGWILVKAVRWIRAGFRGGE